MKRWMFPMVLALGLCGPALAGGDPEDNGRAPHPRVDETETVNDEMAPEPVEVTSRGERGVEIGRGVVGYGSLGIGYVRNLADPSVRKNANELRLSDPDHNTATLHALFGLQRGMSGKNELDCGFRLELGLGRLMEKALAEDGLFDDQPIDLPQAYAQVQLPAPWGLPVSVKAGRWVFMHGGEGLDLEANQTFSLGYMASFGPKTMTGASLTVKLPAGLSYEQFVANGWDRAFEDDNDAKTVGGVLTCDLGNLVLHGGWVLGAERANNVSDHRWAVNVDAAWSPVFGTDLSAAFMYGEEEGADLRDDGLARFGGISAGIRQGLLMADEGGYHHVALVARGEVFRDAGGSRSGTHQDLAQVTGGIEFQPVEGLSLRAEYRHDWSSQDVFGGKDEQSTVALSLGLKF